jgi:hypothetical protein
LLNLLIIANQAINLVLGQASKLIESARPVSKALPLMPVNDTVYFRQISHIRRSLPFVRKGDHRRPALRDDFRSEKILLHL